MILIAECFFVFLFGVLIGNFTTTIFHRLPRGIVLYGFNQKTTQPPFCSKCGHALKFYEYLPILSWISTRGTCNYCSAPITLSYFFLEILGGVFAVICALLYGDNIEYYIIMFGFSLMANLAFFLSYEHKKSFKEITASLIFTGILYRTLSDQSILPWFTVLCLAGIVSLYILKDNLHSKSRQEFVHLILPASVWLNFPWIIIFAISLVGMLLCARNFYRIGLVLLVVVLNFTACF